MQELVPGISGADPTAAGLLVECRGQSEEALNVNLSTSSSLAKALHGNGLLYSRTALSLLVRVITEPLFRGR